jgi:esterase/lipase superfamily enzyme
MIDETTFQREWTRVVEEDRSFERLVAMKLRALKLDKRAEEEARKRFAHDAERVAVRRWARSIGAADLRLIQAGVSRETAVRLLGWAPSQAGSRVLETKAK